MQWKQIDTIETTLDKDSGSSKKHATKVNWAKNGLGIGNLRLDRPANRKKTRRAMLPAT